VRLTRWSIPTVVLAGAVLAALLTPAGRDVAIMAGRSAAVSYCRLLPWVRPPDFLSPVERAAERHKDDPVILQGLAESGYGAELSLRLYQRALELKPSDPSLHAGMIRAAMRQHWHEKRLIDQWGIRPDSKARELLKIITTHSAWGMEHDPENSFFCYAQACVDATLGNGKAAVEQFVAGSHKPRFDTYLKEARQAALKAAHARGRTRLEAQGHAFSGLLMPFYGPLNKLGKLTAEEARKADAEGRSAEARRLDLAIFRTGRLLATTTGDQIHRGMGLRMMMLAGPQVPQQEIKAAAEAGQRSAWETRLQLQSQVFQEYMLSHGVSRHDVDRMSKTMMAAYRELTSFTSSLTDFFVDRVVLAEDRARAGIFLAALALFVATGLGILGLLLKPVVRWLTSGETRAAGWSAGTSAILWTLLLTPLASVVILYARALSHGGLYFGPGFAFARLGIGGMTSKPIMIALAGTLLLLAGTAISIPRQFAEGRSIRRPAMKVAVLMLLAVFEDWWLYQSLDLWRGVRLVVDAGQIGLALVLVFSLVRGWIVSRRMPGTGAADHFFTSFLASCRTVALGSVVLFVVSLYVALPLYAQAVRAMDQYLAMVSG